MSGSGSGSGLVVTAFMAGMENRREEAPSEGGHEKQRTVRDVMSTPVVHVPPNTPIKAVAELLLSERISAVPVVNPHGHLLGMVSEEDLLVKQIDLTAGAHVPWLTGGHLAHEFRRRREARTAEELMSTPVTCVHPDTTLRQAAKTMYLRHLKRLPVIDGSSLVGIVSRSDVLRVYLMPDEHLRHHAENLLRGALGLGAAKVSVGVAEGVVTLEGEVSTHSEADLVTRLMRTVDGVVGVEARLRWRVDDHVGLEGHRPVHS
ncbi:MAG: CBS domain-containing protein [Candidatus Dormibacteria bacterium]